ncbi:glycerol-3-phosphate 1-O-acyltransferase PlsY [Candidatus Saganbacteria bacterium]|uniref:Glycerol-3-phosphate acyltransferase n=1 Tax=Candidatus Saganbacteria bacterium TaxID=2575572 RepID=A0A9D6UM78_UNCSA|nr:glycerol-3-phosphate 1-O-acyltransferase PlsY [Candidatus Saganbacteria bacterium]
MPILLIIAGYLLGSVPFGVIVARIWNIDIREHGSGNIGATNVFRILGVFPGTIVLLLDFLKGTLAVGLGYWMGETSLIVLLMGVSAIFGHMFPVFLGFKGGKGAATGLGVLAGLTPDIFIIAAVLAAIIIFSTRYVSVASIGTPFVVALLMFIKDKPLPYTIATLIVVVFVIIRHIPNIKRLIKGTEPRLGGG